MMWGSVFIGSSGLPLVPAVLVLRASSATTPLCICSAWDLPRAPAGVPPCCCCCLRCPCPLLRLQANCLPQLTHPVRAASAAPPCSTCRRTTCWSRRGQWTSGPWAAPARRPPTRPATPTRPRRSTSSTCWWGPAAAKVWRGGGVQGAGDVAAEVAAKVWRGMGNAESSPPELSVQWSPLRWQLSSAAGHAGRLLEGLLAGCWSAARLGRASGCYWDAAWQQQTAPPQAAPCCRWAATNRPPPSPPDFCPPGRSVWVLSLEAQLQAGAANLKLVTSLSFNAAGCTNASRCVAVAWLPGSSATSFVVGHRWEGVGGGWGVLNPGRRG